MIKKKAIKASLLLLLFVPSLVFGQDRIELTKVSDPIELDGRLTEAAWQQAEPLDMVMYQPTYKGTPSEKSEIYVIYDEDYIYLGGRLYHDDPSDIRGNSYYRDRYSGDDTFAIILDSFNDKENALWFFTNPLGNRFDSAISNDAEGGPDFNWNTFWNVATTRDEKGWYAEMRIPFSSLGFQGDEGRVVMGLIVYRYLAKSNERYVYPDISPRWDNGFRKPSLAQEIVLHDVNSENPVYVTPYLLGGVERQSFLNASSGQFDASQDLTREIGGDIKYNLTNNLTVDLTVNTDFAQVESDEQQVNLTRFPLFFPEKRQFFQERASVFSFGFSRRSRLFHSRRIGLDSEGRQIRILGGTRLVGRVGETDIGFINMQTADSENLPSENFGVLRIRRNVFNRYSDMGAMFTSRIGADGSYNFAYGADALVRAFGDEYITLKLAQTVENERSYDFGRSSRFYFNWERRRNEGFSYEWEYEWSGEDFTPGVGFFRRRDFSFYSGGLDYLWFTEKSSRFRSVHVFTRSRAFFRNRDGTAESAFLAEVIKLEAMSGANFEVSFRHNFEDILVPFVIFDDGNIEIPAGSYWYHEGSFEIEAPNGWRYRPSLDVTAGEFFDGNHISITTGQSLNLSRFLELGSDYIWNHVEFPDRDTGFDSHLIRFRIRGSLNTHVSLNSFIQFNNESNRVGINSRFRYNFREGQDLWIVYNESLNTDRFNPAGPNLPKSDFRSVLIKYTHTFKF